MEVLSLSITLGSVITILGIIIAILSYRLNKKKETKSEIDQAAHNEGRLVRIETDTLYIRQKLDGFESKFLDTEKRLTKLENAVTSLQAKGGK